MAKLHIDITGAKGLGGNWYGYDDQTVPTPQTDYLVEPGKLVGGFFNPYMRPGYLSPSIATLTAMTPSSFTIDTVPGSSIYDSINGDYYFGCRGEQLIMGADLDTTTVTLAYGLGSTGTPVIHDLEIYQKNGVRYLFIVYETGGNLQVAINSLPFSAGSANLNLTWLTGTVTGAFTLATTSSYNFMRVSDNGYAYLFADNAVHKIDGTVAGGTNGTVTANVLLFPTYFRLHDAIDYRGNIFMVIHQTTEDMTIVNSNGALYSTACGVYVWNRQSTVVSMSDYIPLTGVRAIKKIYVAPSGEIRLITISSSGMSQIRKYTGSSFEIIQEMGLGAAPQYADSLTVTDLITVWVGTDGSIYSHGPVKPGEPDALAKIGQIKVTETTYPENTITAGAILYGGANSFSVVTGYRVSRQGFTIGYVDGSTKSLKKFYPFDLGTINSVTQLPLAGNVYTPVTLLPPLSKINYIRLYHNAITGTASTIVQGTLSIYLNQSTTANITSSITRADLVKGWKYIPVNQGAKNAVFAVQFKIVWPIDAQLVDSIDWLPRMIEIDYDIIEKKQ